MAATHGIHRTRVHEVIRMTGLSTVARTRVGSFSLGMGQRLGVAAALLGDPRTLVLDEPVNGLDPEDVLRVPTLVRRLAGEGRTVFLSSHLMTEMALTADHIVVIGRGRILADAPVADVIARAIGTRVRVCTPEATTLAELLRRPDITVTSPEPCVSEVAGSTAPAIGGAAFAAGITYQS